MKSYLALAWKELKAQKITAILILVAVIMSTIMTTVIGQSIGILQSMRIQQAAGLNGNRYATFHQLGKEQAQKLHEDDRLYDVGDTIFIGSTPLGNSSLSLYLREYHDNALSMYPAIGNVKEGRLPEEAIEIALSEDALQYLGLDAVIGDTVSLDLSVSVKQALKDGTGCLVKNPIAFSYGDTTVQQTDLTVGDTIQLGDRTLPVLGLIDTAITINNDGFTNGVQLIVNDEIYCSLLGNDSYSEVYPTLQDNADTDTFESWLDSWCSNYPGTHWLSYLQSSNEMIESFEQIKMLCWVLIIFIGIIGILNIINTVYSNIHTRVGEIGMQRAIGMSAASLYKTFLWEGAYYGIIASVIGAVFGYVCCIFVGAAQTDALQLVAVPVMAIVEAAIISIVACLLATAIPLRSIARMSIVDSIETVE